MQFLKINELMENHRTAALGHGNLSRNIRLQLALPREERKKEGLKFVEECKTTYDSLLEQSPPIPKHILLNFEREYPRDSNFTKPEILRVRAIPLLKTLVRNTPLEKVLKKDGEPDEEEIEVEIEVSDEEEEEITSEDDEDLEQGRTGGSTQ
jgi:hypothetical protein